METKILIVDDSLTDLMIIKNMLSEYTLFTASNGLEAMEQIDRNPDLDLVILDLNMPIMDGFQVLQRLRSDFKYDGIRVIILTNYDEIDNEIRGLELGAVDYIRKPVNIQSLKIRINIHLKLKTIQKLVEQENIILDQKVAEATQELIATRDITIHALVGLLDVRNYESYNHTIRTQKMMACLCNRLRTKPAFQNILSDSYIHELVATTPLHDIGKVGIPDSILLKPGKLTYDEFEIMKKHVGFGVEALTSELRNAHQIPQYIMTALEIINNHHEKFDGTGYPNGLINGSIPLPGRLMAIIDVFDALISKRVYKEAYPWDEAIKIMADGSGKHFDPEILSAFFEITDEIREIVNLYQK